MKSKTLAALALSLTLAGTCMAQQTNEEARKYDKAVAKQDQKADKAQAKADKAQHKALKSDKVKDAAKAQDKANHEADKTPNR